MAQIASVFWRGARRLSAGILLVFQTKPTKHHVKRRREMGHGRAEGPTRTRPDNSIAGFTLVEILVVLAIIAMVISMGMPAISRVTYQRLNSTTRKFVGLTRTIKDDAILLNTIHRLVIDLDHQTYWVEQQRQFQLLSDQLPDPKKSSNKKKGKKGDSSSTDVDPATNFQPDQKFSKEPTPLPDGVSVFGVLTERALFKQGIAYVNFFPNGYNDPAVIYLVRSGSQNFDGYSLVLRPVSGLIDIRRSYVQSLDGQ